MRINLTNLIMTSQLCMDRIFMYVLTVLIFCLLPGLGCRKTPSLEKVRYGITPYQDTAIPFVAEELQWYKDNGIDVEFVPLAWGDVVNAIAGGAIDVALYNFNSFQAPYENAAQGNIKPVFYCAMYVFKGAAIIIHEKSTMKPFRELPNEPDSLRKNRVIETARQLKGKKIAVTKGTEYEQIVLAALSLAGLNPQKDVKLIHATPEDALAAFLANDVDAFGAGLTERVEARRHEGTELLVASDVSPPIIDGLITSERFAQEHQVLLDKLVRLWFQTIQFMEKDLKTNSKYVLDYLTKKASTRYTPEEYSVAWTFQIFPPTTQEAYSLLYNETSPYFWRRAWSANNEFLLSQGKIKSPVPYDAFWGEQVIKRLISQ